MYVSKEAIERVRRSSDLVSVIEGRGVKLTQNWKNLLLRSPWWRTPLVDAARHPLR